MAWLERVTLKGQHATLLPLDPAQNAELANAVRDGELWNLWYTAIPKPEAMQAEIARRLKLQETGSMLAFAVQSVASGKIVGMTTYMNVDAAVKRVEIGSTWYAQSAQKSAN